MASIGIDHIAIPTADAERLILFYKKLGFTINDEKEWREGKVNIFNIQVGDSKINVHPEGYILVIALSGLSSKLADGIRPEVDG